MNSNEFEILPLNLKPGEWTQQGLVLILMATVFLNGCAVMNQAYSKMMALPWDLPFVGKNESFHGIMF